MKYSDIDINEMKREMRLHKCDKHSDNNDSDDVCCDDYGCYGD